MTFGQLLSSSDNRIVLAAGAVVGGLLALVVAGLAYAGLMFTSTTDFCISCHSMQKPYNDYRRSSHFTNRSGVRAACADCHVPHHPLAFAATKIGGLGDLWGEMVGSLAGDQKFAVRKLELAQKVWARMEASGSRECLSCHAFDAMKTDVQTQKTRNRHPKAIARGETCIICHKALVHSRPDMGPLTEQARVDVQRVMGRVGAGSTVVRTLEIKPIFAAADGETAAGRVLPGAEMALLGFEGAMARVKLSGWRQEGAERVLYGAPGKRVLLVSLAAAFIERLDTAGDAITVPDTGQVWSPASFEAYVPVADVTADTDRVWDFAQALFGVNCSMCHARPHVNEYGANEWAGIFRSMVEQTNLDREERALVQIWLQLNARDSDAAE